MYKNNMYKNDKYEILIITNNFFMYCGTLVLPFIFA